MRSFEVYEKKFAASGWRVFVRAADEARRGGQNYLSVECLTSALSQEEPDIFAAVLRETGADGAAFRAALDERLDAGAWHDGEGLRLAPDAIKLFKLALARAHRHRRPKIEPVDLFVALAFDAHGALCEIMSGLGVGQGTLVKAVVELESAFEVARAFADAGANLSGKQVRIRSGPFANFTGYINDVRNDEKKLEVGVSIFGARRFIELNYRDIEILDFARPQ